MLYFPSWNKWKSLKITSLWEHKLQGRKNKKLSVILLWDFENLFFLMQNPDREVHWGQALFLCATSDPERNWNSETWFLETTLESHIHQQITLSHWTCTQKHPWMSTEMLTCYTHAWKKDYVRHERVIKRENNAYTELIVMLLDTSIDFCSLIYFI